MEKKKLNWYNLKKNKCPKCGKDWAFDLTVVDGVLAHGCGFKISEKKYREILNDRITSDLPTYEEE
jgi:hypothetical protein